MQAMLCIKYMPGACGAKLSQSCQSDTHVARNRVLVPTAPLQALSLLLHAPLQLLQQEGLHEQKPSR